MLVIFNLEVKSQTNKLKSYQYVSHATISEERYFICNFSSSGTRDIAINDFHDC